MLLPDPRAADEDAQPDAPSSVRVLHVHGHVLLTPSAATGPQLAGALQAPVTAHSRQPRTRAAP